MQFEYTCKQLYHVENFFQNIGPKEYHSCYTNFVGNFIVGQLFMVDYT